MQSYHLRRFVPIILSALLLLSCSSSGGIGGSGFVGQGTVAGHGSIIVNGTVIDTSRATIIVEGEIVGIGDDAVVAYLDIGKVVTVEGIVRPGSDNYVANRVTYSKNVEGPVENIIPIDAKTRDIVVLGQTVRMNTVTQFEATTFDKIAVNDLAEVSGFRDDAGVIWATFVKDTGDFTPPEMVEVKGFVANLDDPIPDTFEINALVVNYETADTSELPDGKPKNGMYVEVEGTLDALGGTMLANEIKPGDELGTSNADDIEVTGFVTDFVSAFEFTVGQIAVETDNLTVYVDGTSADIAPGVKLEAEGSLIDGVLFAIEVEFWEPEQIEVEGLVTNIVSPSEFTVGSQVVQTDGNTIFEGGDADDIALGVMLEVKGVPIDIDRTVLLADKVSFE